MDTKLFNTVKELRDRGLTWGKIADKINAMGYRKKSGVKHCDKSVSMILIEQEPSYKSYERKAKRGFSKRKTLITATPNEVAIDLILSNKALSIKDRLEIAKKLL